MGEMIEMWKKKHNAFGIVYSWFLAKVWKFMYDFSKVYIFDPTILGIISICCQYIQAV